MKGNRFVNHVRLDTIRDEGRGADISDPEEMSEEIDENRFPEAR